MRRLPSPDELAALELSRLQDIIDACERRLLDGTYSRNDFMTLIECEGEVRRRKREEARLKEEEKERQRQAVIKSQVENQKLLLTDDTAA